MRLSTLPGCSSSSTELGRCRRVRLRTCGRARSTACGPMLGIEAHDAGSMHCQQWLLMVRAYCVHTAQTMRALQDARTAGMKEPWWFFSPPACTRQRMSNLMADHSAPRGAARHTAHASKLRADGQEWTMGKASQAQRKQADALPSPVSVGLASFDDMVMACVESTAVKQFELAS